MLKSADGGLRAVPFPIDDPERIPVQRYFDADFYQAELDNLWPHVWQMACRDEQIPEVGDWIEYENVGKSVIVVRTKSGVKAFHNACRHRGVPFAGGAPLGSSHPTAHGNCAKTGFVCPFHGWRWNMDGENTLVYGKHLFSERQMDEDDINLIPCRAEVWGGCVWINHDDDAPSVKESLGPVADRLEAHHVQHLRAEWCYGAVLPANWKIAMEAFMEGYHVMQTHPQLQHAAPMLYDGMYKRERKPVLELADPELSLRENIDIQIRSMELLSEGMAGMIHEKEVEIAKTLADVTEGLPEDKNLAVMTWLGMVMHQISEKLKAKGEPIPDLCAVSQSDPINAVEFLFPHYFLLPYFSSMSAYRIRPLGPESCFFEIWSLTFFPEGEEPEPVMEPIVLPYDSPDFPPIPRQDYSNIPIQQKGLHAKGFEFMRLSKDVEGLISNYQRIIDGYLAGVPQDKLAKANNLLGGNFDGKIAELGF
ncbi:aromatic ring-hydroxylating oxygenase subunit alpha [Novosphingobium album (ex Liu et al. 2023)]|uniref:Aromatic ring-hydroxylating dioxygenase subunit alpha n=1 Tax=Novosphingobium album (ex Liu et al. 2023) TaxID=3031130 RepID=A0ABT5WTU0_9SPHN|nr:aromatic ring-hydroxylating dioxygenase subunit alpha [Novosphingobium album (ex Liu et al. 2023)]MDE8653304.1 aromatic ring-hydroxylating dioxygenase subunit alpha [Novosphingobium album (ex Liu et al. 2023)]